MSASEIVNKVWNYALYALQNPFGFRQAFSMPRSAHDGEGDNNAPEKYYWARFDNYIQRNKFNELQYCRILAALGKYGHTLNVIFRIACYSRSVIVHTTCELLHSKYNKIGYDSPINSHRHYI